MSRKPSALGLGHDIGDRVPIATAGIGRAYIAAAPAAERSRILDELRRQLEQSAFVA